MKGGAKQREICNPGIVQLIVIPSWLNIKFANLNSHCCLQEAVKLCEIGLTVPCDVQQPITATRGSSGRLRS